MFEGHFLSALFTGLEDMPPAYAIDAPAVFDASLPNLNMNGEFRFYIVTEMCDVLWCNGSTVAATRSYSRENDLVKRTKRQTIHFFDMTSNCS